MIGMVARNMELHKRLAVTALAGPGTDPST